MYFLVLCRKFACPGPSSISTLNASESTSGVVVTSLSAQYQSLGRARGPESNASGYCMLTLAVRPVSWQQSLTWVMGSASSVTEDCMGSAWTAWCPHTAGFAQIPSLAWSVVRAVWLGHSQWGSSCGLGILWFWHGVGNGLLHCQHDFQTLHILHRKYLNGRKREITLIPQEH